MAGFISAIQHTLAAVRMFGSPIWVMPDQGEQGTMEDGKTDAGGPVTATIAQQIDPECEQAYEALLAAIHTEARAFGGFLRREVIKGTAGPHLEYTSVLHFDNEANLHRWERSPERLRPASARSRVGSCSPGGGARLDQTPRP